MARPETTAIRFDDDAEYVRSNPRLMVRAWWDGLSPYERVLYRGLAALAIGLAPVYWPLAFIVPGVVVTGLAVLWFWRVGNG
jgi:hypothetical protein